MTCPAAYAQGCADCATNARAEDTVSSGEWLLTKQVNEVSVIFVALRNGKAVGGLSQQDISVRDDDKTPSAILGFRTEQALPLRVGVAIDTSNSVTSRFRFEQDAASAFFRQAVRESDLGFVMGFENHPKVTQDFAGDPDLLSKGVDQLKPGGGTALYDAVRAACQKLRNHPEQDIVARVLIVLSDGQNNAGEVTQERAIDAAQEAEVTIYTISTNYDARYAPLPDLAAAEGNSILRKLAEQTGGRVLFPSNPKDVAKAFAKIEEELRSRYAVSYKPSEFTPDGHYRSIKIEARKSGAKVEVRARKGYYARAASWLSSDPAEEETRTSALAVRP